MVEWHDPDSRILLCKGGTLLAARIVQLSNVVDTAEHILSASKYDPNDHPKRYAPRPKTE